MPPRLTIRVASPAFARRFARFYSTENAGPLIQVTNVAAPGSGHIRVLELNRPAARNAISKALLASIRQQVDDVQSQYGPDGTELARQGSDPAGPTRAVVLASAVDASFCAGADLKERRGFTPEETAAFLSSLRSTFADLSTLPIPTISAVSSLALGGGLELALATHFRVLASTAVVGLPETRLGIIPGAGGTYRLPAIIGVARARDMVLTGRRVSAPEAYFLGLADRLVEIVPLSKEENGGKEEAAEDIPTRARKMALAEAVRMAGEICEGGPVAVRAALRAVENPHETVENAMYERVIGTQDRDEALAAFREKRKPIFKGR